jgi:hypothetical protein
MKTGKDKNTVCGLRSGVCGKDKSPRSGLAADIRRVLKGASRPVAYSALYRTLNTTPGKEVARVGSAVGDFIKRGEITKTPSGLLKYNDAYKSKIGPVKSKVLKAIYISTEFSINDIANLAGTKKSYVEDIMEELLKSGHVLKVCRRACVTTPEWVYNVTDRVKFRLEVME